jgi:hypothetical protein
MTTARNCARVVDGKLMAESMSAKIAMRLKTYEDFDLGKTSLPLVHCGNADGGMRIKRATSINEDTFPNPHSAILNPQLLRLWHDLNQYPI